MGISVRELNGEGRFSRQIQAKRMRGTGRNLRLGKRREHVHWRRINFDGRKTVEDPIPPQRFPLKGQWPPQEDLRRSKGGLLGGGRESEKEDL